MSGFQSTSDPRSPPWDLSPLSWEGALSNYNCASRIFFRGTLVINVRQVVWDIRTRKSWQVPASSLSSQASSTNCKHYPTILLTLHPTLLARVTNTPWWLDLPVSWWPCLTFCVGNSAHAFWQMPRQCMIRLLLATQWGFQKLPALALLCLHLVTQQFSNLSSFSVISA